MTQHQADELKQLSKSHPVPSEDKLARCVGRLERMTKFYEEKAIEAPKKQSLMFTGFVSAVMYALTTIKMYRRLTKRLAEMAAEGDENALRTDSKG